MRILSARVSRATRNRQTGRVEAIVVLLVEHPGLTDPQIVRQLVSAPARAPGAVGLRDRLISAAKLGFAASPRVNRGARWAA